MQQLGDAGADEGRADQHLPVQVEDDPGPAAVVVAVERGPGDRAEVVVDRLDPQSGPFGGVEGQTDGGDLRLREDHLGRAGAVGGRGVRAPALGVQRARLGAGDDRRAGDPRLVLALMGEQRPVVDVPGGVQPRAVDAEHGAAVVHVEPVAGVQTDLLQADVGRARGAPGGVQHLVHGQPPAVAQGERDLGRAVRRVRPARPVRPVRPVRAVHRPSLQRGHLRPEPQVHPEVPQTVRDQLTGERLRPGQQRGAADQQHHLRAECPPGGGEFHADHPAAHHGKPPGDGGRAGRLAVGPRSGVGQSGHVARQHRAAPGADRDGVPGDQQPLAAVLRLDRHLPFAGQPAVAPGQFDAGVTEPLHLAVVLPVRGEGVTPRQHRCRVQRPAADRLPGTGHRAGVGQRGHRAQQRLARHAGPVRTLAADQFALHDHRAQPGGGRPVGDVLAGGARADHDDVELLGGGGLGGGHTCSSLLWIGAVVRADGAGPQTCRWCSGAGAPSCRHAAPASCRAHPAPTGPPGAAEHAGEAPVRTTPSHLGGRSTAQRYGAAATGYEEAT